jgi:serine/threonine protein kinase
VDWWALGVFVYELLVGQPPFVDEEGPLGVYEQVLNRKPTFPKWMDRDAKALVKVGN